MHPNKGRGLEVCGLSYLYKLCRGNGCEGLLVIVNGRSARGGRGVIEVYMSDLVWVCGMTSITKRKRVVGRHPW